MYSSWYFYSVKKVFSSAAHREYTRNPFRNINRFVKILLEYPIYFAVHYIASSEHKTLAIKKQKPWPASYLWRILKIIKTWFYSMKLRYDVSNISCLKCNLSYLPWYTGRSVPVLVSFCRPSLAQTCPRPWT